MKETIVERITHAAGRRTLYHFTRARNLPAITRLNTLYASHETAPWLNGERRQAPQDIMIHEERVTINAHLRIVDAMFAPGVTPEQFRACLDRHVFFWPTKRDCLKMAETYGRREPDEPFAILACDAKALLTAYYDRVKVSKYDSGSSPRYPNNCSYRKTPEMLLPLQDFGKPSSSLVPASPSQIKEVLVEKQVEDLSDFVRTIYVDDRYGLLEGDWQKKRTSLHKWIEEML